jgi:hypothetical protein
VSAEVNPGTLNGVFVVVDGCVNAGHVRLALRGMTRGYGLLIVFHIIVFVLVMGGDLLSSARRGFACTLPADCCRHSWHGVLVARYLIRELTVTKQSGMAVHLSCSGPVCQLSSNACLSACIIQATHT